MADDPSGPSEPSSPEPLAAAATIADTQRPQAAPVPTPGPAPEPDEDWPAKVTDLIVDRVDQVREQTTGRAVTVARGIKFGVVLAPLALVILVLALIGLFRGTEALFIWIFGFLPGESTWWSEPMWLVYLFYGAIFSIVGLVLWRKGNRATVAS